MDLPGITVSITTPEVVPAEVAGNIIQTVARAFDRHARKQMLRDLRLGIRRVGIGSLIIDLVIIGREPGRPGPDEVARKFVSATAWLIKLAQGLTAGSVRKIDARLINALSTLVTGGIAERVDRATN
jgi:hypothetical protein